MTTYSQIAGVLRMRRVRVIAHRGDSRHAPENTLPAFTAAAQLHVNFVELDYRHSADGVPFAFHDEDLDRCTDACAQWGGRKIPFAAKTAAELRTLDAGAWFNPRFAGTRIPTLEEAIDAICAGGSLPLIERKAGDAATFIELAARRGNADRVALMAFDWDFLAACRSLSPKLTLGALGEKELSERQLDQIVSIGAAFVGWNNEHLTKAHIDAIHERGLQAWVWTVDDPRRAEQLIDFGIDAITSNVPAAIQAVVAAHPQASGPRI